MIEYQDGHFGVIAPANDILDLLRSKYDELEKVKSVHFGTPDELVAVRQGKTGMEGLHERLSELEKEMTSLKATGPIKVYSMEDIPRDILLK